MRGEDRRSGSLFSYVDIEKRVRSDHPQIPAPACLLVNWPIMAQVTIGAPMDWFEDESMAELLVEGDPIGQHLMRKHWPEIERVAEALLLKGRLSEIEALAMLESPEPHNSSNSCRTATT